MKEGSSCCRAPLKPGRNAARFCLLALLIALYMLAGALVFSSLERPAELRAHRLWEERFKDFSHKHEVGSDDLKSLLRHYEEARTSGVRAEQARALWDLPGAFYFVGTVISTIGFGVTAPSTVAGKVLLVFYGLFGCSAAILFFNLFLERVITLLACVIGPGLRERTGPRGQKSGVSTQERPSVHQVSLILFVVVALVACVAASLYSAMEGWTYLESLYFCFVAFSTVGFGDLVSSQRAQHGETRAYQVANCLLMLLGVCCTYSLFNAIAAVINQGLGWLLGNVERLQDTARHCYAELPPLLTLCSSESNTCTGEDGTLDGHRMIVASRPDHSMTWRCSVPSAIGNYLSGKSYLEIMSNRNA